MQQGGEGEGVRPAELRIAVDYFGQKIGRLEFGIGNRKSSLKFAASYFCGSRLVAIGARQGRALPLGARLIDARPRGARPCKAQAVE